MFYSLKNPGKKSITCYKKILTPLSIIDDKLPYYNGF